MCLKLWRHPIKRNRECLIVFLGKSWNANCLFMERQSKLKALAKTIQFNTLKGLSHEIFTGIFWLERIYLGLNENRYWFLNFKGASSILDSYFKYWCVPYQTFSEILRISEKDWQLSLRFSNFSFFQVSSPPRNGAKGVNTSQRFVESPRMIDNQFSGSPRMFFNNISVSLRQLSILLGDMKHTKT